MSLLLSCQQKKSSKNMIGNEKSNDQEVTADTESKKPSINEIKTSTDKTFRVTEDKTSESLSNLTIEPRGFPNTQEVFKIDGSDPLSGMFTLDLNKDGFDELYLITTAAGSGSYSGIIGYASNSDQSVTPIYVPEMTENDLASDGDYFGYMGHDSIYVANEQLYRKFPVYMEGDENCCPTGGNKTLGYSLKAGEASWILETVK
jgi:hypothetical protein